MIAQTLAGTAARWQSALAAQEARVPVLSLYAGRSFRDAVWCAEYTGGRLYVVSAGLGLIHDSQAVPVYDLTASGSAGGLGGALAAHRASLADWWTALCRKHALARLVAAHPGSITLVALPANYVRMLSRDLRSLSARDMRRVRLFTSSSGSRELDPTLLSCFMPYDQRLEAVSGYAGTRADFPQRALRHFVEALAGHSLDLDEARTAVVRALSSRSVRPLPQGTRASDGEIRLLLRSQWIARQGRAGLLLRYLRDEAHVACEQGRFSRLWRELRAELMPHQRTHPEQRHASCA